MSAVVVPSLYTICFDYIKNHTEALVSLEGVPYKPTVENLLKHVFTSDVPLTTSFLTVVAQAHGKALRAAHLAWTRIMFQSLPCSVYPRLMTLSRDFPHFITHLKMGSTDVCDDDIYLLARMTNLMVLDLSNNQNMTDRTVASIATLQQQQDLIHLKELYFDNVKGITDKSLKFIGKLDALQKVYLTGTRVTESVAKTYLSSKGYSCDIKPRVPYFTERLSRTNFKMHQFIERCSCEYPIPPINNNKRRMHDYSVKYTSSPRADDARLDFWRNEVAAAAVIPIKRKVPTTKAPQNAKRPKVGDFLAMMQHELESD